MSYSSSILNGFGFYYLLELVIATLLLLFSVSELPLVSLLDLWLALPATDNLLLDTIDFSVYFLCPFRMFLRSYSNLFNYYFYFLLFSLNFFNYYSRCCLILYFYCLFFSALKSGLLLRFESCETAAPKVIPSFLAWYKTPYNRTLSPF
jgi:hypothetical protein